MAAEARPDGLGRQHRRQQRRPFAAGDRRAACPRRAQPRQRIGQRLAGLARPQRIGRRAASAAAMRRLEQRVRRAHRRVMAATSSGRSLRQALDQVDDPVPVAFAAELAVGHAEPERPEPGSGLRPRRHLRSSRRAASSRSARDRPSVHSGCLSSASRSTGAKPESTAATSARSKVAGGVSARRLAGGIVDVDLPAPQLGGDATREVAVGRHQRGGARRRLQRLAQGERDHQRLLVRRGAVGAGHVIERGGLGPLPGVGRLGRPHQLGDQLATRRIARRAGPFADLVAVAVEREQQVAQAELRMGRVELRPALLVDLAVEARQHDGALRQSGDRRQQIARRGLRAGRAGGDHRRCRRPLAPARGLGADRSGAPVERVDLAARRPGSSASARRRWRGTSACAASGWRSCRRPALRAGRTARRRSPARRAGSPARARASAPARPTARSAGRRRP